MSWSPCWCGEFFHLALLTVTFLSLIVLDPEFTLKEYSNMTPQLRVTWLQILLPHLLPPRLPTPQTPCSKSWAWLKWPVISVPIHYKGFSLVFTHFPFQFMIIWNHFITAQLFTIKFTRFIRVPCFSRCLSHCYCELGMYLFSKFKLYLPRLLYEIVCLEIIFEIPLCIWNCLPF